MGTLGDLGLILMGVAIGFILTKGYLLEKSIREKSKKDKEEKS